MAEKPLILAKHVFTIKVALKMFFPVKQNEQWL